MSLGRWGAASHPSGDDSCAINQYAVWLYNDVAVLIHRAPQEVTLPRDRYEYLIDEERVAGPGAPALA